MCVYVYTHPHAICALCRFVCVYVYMHVCLYLCVCEHVHMCVGAWVQSCVCVCMCVCPGFISDVVVKFPDKKQLKGEGFLSFLHI